MIKTVKNPPVARARRAGFTLVEVLLVLLLLSSLALVTVLFVDNADDQVRFEQTRSRLEQIRRAIVGDTSRTLNGEPVISGFVADMGRLPENLSELIERGSNTPWDAFGFDIVLSGVTPPAYPDGVLYGGWRGPYLDGIQESDVAGVSGVRATLRDGWGNRSQKEIEDDEKDDNFGWLFHLKATSDPAVGDPDESDPAKVRSLLLQSVGSDGKQDDPDNPPEGTYQRDYPPEGYKIAQNDWALMPEDGKLRTELRLNKAPASDQSGLRLQLYYLVGNTQKQIDVGPFDVVSGVVTPSTLETILDVPMPMGTYAAVVVCPDGHVYDGGCSSSVHPPYYFKLVPRAFTPPLTVNWTVQ